MWNGSWLNALNTALNLYEVCQLDSPGETDGETCTSQFRGNEISFAIFRRNNSI